MPVICTLFQGKHVGIVKVMIFGYEIIFVHVFRWVKCSLYVGLTTLPPSCADCLEIREPQPSQTLRVCTGIALPLHAFRSIYYFMSSTGSVYYVHLWFQSKKQKACCGAWFEMYMYKKF